MVVYEDIATLEFGPLVRPYTLLSTVLDLYTTHKRSELCSSATKIYLLMALGIASSQPKRGSFRPSFLPPTSKGSTKRNAFM